MKKAVFFAVAGAIFLSLSSCAPSQDAPDASVDVPDASVDVPDASVDVPELPSGTRVVLSDSGVTVDGSPVTEDASQSVYAARDIVFYLEGQGFTYGEGTQADEHSRAEADGHTVVHITKSGTYRLSGSLSAGQIAVDLGEDAKDDPEAVVNLVLDGVDITCTVAPAIIFYNVYECGDKDSASSAVDTGDAGANIFIADGSENTVNGSYVARIYKSYQLSEDGSQVVDSKKLHKYDGAVYSKMSMNVWGGDGVLNINAENEGLDSELHLTVNGGVINIVSGNDGINTNEDGVSVTTVNGGALTITVNGSTGEGDGIDSNGWLVINGGDVHAYACASSGDAGIDSDMGIIINGGRVVATGNMLDAIDKESAQSYVIFNMDARDLGGAEYTLTDAQGNGLMDVPTKNAFSIIIVSCPGISDGSYSLYNGGVLAASAEAGDMGNFGHGFMGGGGRRPEGMEPPESGQRPETGEAV